MIKALIIESPKLGPVGWWRCYGPLQEMRRQFPGDFDFRVVENFSEGDLMGVDVVFLCRPSKPEEATLIATAKKVGCKIVLDYDDDLLNLHPMSPVYMNFSKPERRNATLSCVAMADLIWTTTQSIADSIGRECVIVPNAIPSEWLPKSHAPINKSATWRGREVQYIDVVLQGWASGWYDRIKDLPDTWHWMGWMPFPLTAGQNHIPVPYDNILRYWDYIKSNGINIVWKPLLDCTFNNGKSNIAWIEATVGGGVCVTNYAGRVWWEHCLPDFDFSEKVISDTWQVSAECIFWRHNLALEARKRFESISALL